MIVLSDLDTSFCVQLDLYARLGKGSEASQAYSSALQKLGNIVKAYG